jgi:hypothetical protein
MMAKCSLIPPGFFAIDSDFLRNSTLSPGLKAQILGGIDAVDFRGLTIIRISIPAQSSVSFVGNRCFTREGSETKEVVGPDILALQERFRKGIQ